MVAVAIRTVTAHFTPTPVITPFNRLRPKRRLLTNGETCCAQRSIRKQIRNCIREIGNHRRWQTAIMRRTTSRTSWIRKGRCVSANYYIRAVSANTGRRPILVVRVKLTLRGGVGVFAERKKPTCLVSSSSPISPPTDTYISPLSPSSPPIHPLPLPPTTTTMETPPSGMPSPPLSPHGTPSSLSSDFPSLEGSIYSVLAPDSPCSEPRDYHYYRHNNNNNVAGGGFSSHDVHHEAMRHLILPSLTLQQQREASSRALSGTASVAGFGDYGSSSRQTGIAALPSVGEPSRSSIHHHAVSAIEPPENVRLLVIGRRGAGKTFLCENLVQGSVEGFAWTYEPSLGKVLSQTTPIDEKRRNGLKIVRLDGWNESDEVSRQLQIQSRRKGVVIHKV